MSFQDLREVLAQKQFCDVGFILENLPDDESEILNELLDSSIGRANLSQGIRNESGLYQGALAAKMIKISENKVYMHRRHACICFRDQVNT